MAKSLKPTSADSISIREISNGFVVGESCAGKNGHYEYKETFTPTRPKIQVNAEAKQAKAKPVSSLTKATKALK